MKALNYLFGLPIIVFPLLALSQPSDIPTRPDVAVIAPASTVPKELAAFSGKWVGYYNGVDTGAYMSDGLIVVEQVISPTEVQVFYSGIGRHRINRGDTWSYRVKASFIDGALEVKAGPCDIKARMRGNDSIAVEKTCVRGSNHGGYKRLKN